MSDITSLIRSADEIWASKAPYFNLDRSEYRQPSICFSYLEFGTAANYSPSDNTINISKKSENLSNTKLRPTLEHEINHKIISDCSVSVNNEFGDNVRFQKEIKKRRTHALEKYGSNNVGSNSSPIPKTWQEDLVRRFRNSDTYDTGFLADGSFTDEQFNNLIFQLQSAGVLAMGLAICNEVPTPIGYTAGGVLSSAAIAMTSVVAYYLTYSSIKTYGDAGGERNYVKKVAKLEPESRRFCFMGPFEYESAKSFENTLIDMDVIL